MNVSESSFCYYSSLKRVKEHVEEHYAEPLSLEEIARIACMESKYFSKFFHKKVEVTFTYWRAQLRLEMAVARMRAGDQSITEIAYAVGFGDLRTFERSFKKHMSQTPREFRKSLVPNSTCLTYRT